MKAVILAGGLGSRLSEETVARPKPMIEVGGRPILWHILKIYSAHGIQEFLICLGYKGYLIKEYFVNYFVHMSDITVDVTKNQLEVHQNNAEPWKVTLVDTGPDTMTGGRLKRVRDYLGEEDFCFTYGDGVGNVNISQLISFHKAHGKLATVTAVQPPGRFGALVLSDQNQVLGFQEKPQGDSGWINGGFFVLNPKVIEYIESDTTFWERDPMERLVAENQLSAYLHQGFWQPMDTLRDKNYLEELWEKGNAPWKVWT
ncbi:Glucose-1-phosphate cytidylyltransferase [Gammaproteobacteria bacterium]